MEFCGDKMTASDELILGLDFSTQKLKVVAISAFDLDIVAVFCINYDTDLPEFNTKAGVYAHEDGVTVTVPSLMFLAALDLAFERMKADSFPFHSISAVSGCAQQHGSVYWMNGSREKLRNLSPPQNIAKQLENCFSIANGPVWQDSSTGDECEYLEKSAGGALELATKTGSRAFHRFTANQIAKIYMQNSEAYTNTEHISLVSNFMCSIFLGDYAPIDYADGSGMNLLNLHTKKWDVTLLSACGPNLSEKLGSVVPSRTVLGSISNYFVEKFNFQSDCAITAFTGDNPASMIGLGLSKNDIAISLGTSDTVFLWMDTWAPVLCAHIFCSASDPKAYMGMLCFKNGSLTRERIRQACNCENWADFEKLLALTKPGNDGNIGFYFDMPEILPQANAAGCFRFNNRNEPVDKFPAEIEARAIFENQCISKAIYAQQFLRQNNFLERPTILLTGGASENLSIAQMMANVFDCKIYTTDCPHSAAYGSALQAKYTLNENSTEPKHIDKKFHRKLLADPQEFFVPTYSSMLLRYCMLKCRVCTELESDEKLP